MACPQVSPGIAHLPSRLCPSHLQPHFPYRFWTLKILASLSSVIASMRFLFVEPAFCLGFLHPTPHGLKLAVQLTLPPVGRVRDFHPQAGAPCRAHQQKKPLVLPKGFNKLNGGYLLHTEFPTQSDHTKSNRQQCHRRRFRYSRHPC